MFILEIFDCHGERSAEKTDLPLASTVVHQLLEDGLELRREKLVRLNKHAVKPNNNSMLCWVTELLEFNRFSRETAKEALRKLPKPVISFGFGIRVATTTINTSEARLFRYDSFHLKNTTTYASNAM